MAKKVVGREMTSKVGLDSAEAVKSLKTLTAEVRANTSGWKAQETALKSAGEYQKAAAARVDGLAKSMESQKAKIDELKSRQSGLNKDTKDGEQQYLKLSDQINKASRSYDSMGGQLDRAKSKLQYYNSGLADLQKGYKQSTALSESYVKRLEAEGRSAEANKAKLGGLKQAYSNMEAQYKAQTNELERIKTASGATSDAYKRQQLRVNETATSLAKLKGETNSLEDSMRKASASPFAKAMDSARHKLGLLNSEERKSTENVKHFALGSAIGNSLANAAGSAMNLVKEAGAGIIHAGLEFNKETQKMNATWTTLTGSAKKGTGFVTSINKMSSAFGQSNDLVNELDQQFYHVLDKKAPTEHLTKSLLTMADTLGMSGDQVQRLGLNFTHMMSSGRMQLGDFNMISDQLPMFGERLLDYERKAQKNTKLNMSDLRKQMSAGKISAKDAEAVMNGLGNKYKKASENMMATAFGAERSIKSQFSKLSGDLVAPFSKVQNPIFTSVSKWVSDKKTEKEFTKVGTSASKGFSTISTAFEKAMNVKSIPRSMNKFMENLAKGVTSTSKAIAKHAPAIIGFFKDLWSTTKILGSIGTGFFKGIASGISFVVSPLSKMGTSSKHVSTLTKGLENLSKKKSGLQTFGRVLAGIWATTKVIKFIGAVQKAGTVLKSTWAGQAIISGMSTMIKNVKLFTEVTKGATLAEKASFAIQTAMEAVNPFGWVVLAVAGLAALGTGIYEAYKHFKPFRDAVNGVGHAMSKLFTGKYGWEKTIGKKLSKVGSTISKWGKGAGKFVSKHKKEILAGIVSPFAGLSAWFLKDTKTGKNIQKWSKGFSKDIQKMGFKKAMGKQVNEASKAFSKTKFGKWFKTVSDSFNTWKSSFKKSWNSHWSDMGKSLRNNWNGSVKNTRNFFSTVGKKWNGFKNSFRKGWNSHWNAMTSNLHSAWNSSYKHTRDFFSSMGKKWDGWKSSFRKSWNNHWNDMRSNLNHYWNRSIKHTRDFFSSMGSRWVGWKKSFAHSWNNHWDTMRSNLHSYWNKDLSHTRVFGHSMGDWLSTFKKSFKGGWSSLGTGVENIFKGLWRNLKRFAKGGMNDVIDIINDGIKAVDAVIHSFGSKNKRTIPTLDRLATGTGMFSGQRKPITRPTMAMLNDGNDSPETGNKEAVFLPNGQAGIVQGRNTKAMLPAGTEVLNASETKLFMGMQGIAHFAKGTGFFGDILNSVTSGISGVTSWVGKKVGGLEKFFKTATNIIAHPVKSLENLFSWSSKGVSGVMSNIGHGLFNGVEKQAKTWWSTLWGGVSDSLDSGASSSTLVNAMEKYGATNKYVYGAEGPSAFDCSGLVEYTLKKLGISFPRTSGEQYRASKHVSNPKPGDLVFFGPGGSDHVGVYTGNGEFYSAENEHDGMGISKVHGGGYGSFAGYGRVPGLSDSTSSDKASKSSGLLGTIKKQVGSGFWKFISKLADEFGDGGSSNPGGSGVQRWKPDVIKALKKNGFEASASQVSAWMKVIARESNGDPSVVNNWDANAKAGIPSKGLVQTIQPTFDAYKFSGHNNPLNGYDDLLAGIHYMKAKYGSGASAFARVSGPEGYENGGIINTNQLIEVAEHNKPEMVLPLTNKSRANQLIAQASQVVNGSNGSQTSSTDSESNKKLDKVIALLAALVSGQGNVQAFIAKSDVIDTIKSENKTASQYSQMMGY